MALVCEKCGAENPDNAFFCGKCGAQVRSAFGAEPVGQGLTVKVPEGASEAPPDAAQASPNRIAPPPPTPTAPETPAADRSSFQFGLRDVPVQDSVLDQPIRLDSPAPPPAGSHVPPPPPPGYIPPPPQAGQPYQYPAAPVAVPGYAPPPPDGNTSGMGTAYLAPGAAEGWTFAGCVPAGLFGFVNGSALWGVLGLLGCLGVPFVSWVYAIYIGIKGKELAWQNRRFDSVYQFQDTMRAWNAWGIFWMVLSIVGTILYFVFFFSLGMMGAMEDGAFSSP